MLFIIRARLRSLAVIAQSDTQDLFLILAHFLCFEKLSARRSRLQSAIYRLNTRIQSYQTADLLHGF